MGTVSKRQRSRRRLAAFSFLSNISLDGTHRDTKLGIYNLSLQTDASKLGALSSRTSNNTTSDSDATIRNGKFMEMDPSEENCEVLLVSECVQTKASPRERVHSFVNETKSKLLNQKKKNIPQPVQEYRSVTACSSTESIGLCYSRQTSNAFSESSELRFLRSPKAFHSQRVVLLSPSRTPFLVFSSLSYDKNATALTVRTDLKQDINRRRQVTGSTRALSAITDEVDPLVMFAPVQQMEEGQDISYGSFLSSGVAPSAHRKSRTQEAEYLCVPCPHINRCHSFDPSVSNVYAYNKQPTSPTYNIDRGFEFGEVKFCHHSACLVYTPNLLDDPELVTGKHSTVLTFPSYITSIIDYVKPSDLKKELNEKFKERFPNIQLTLSKLRSLKKEMFKITHLECGVDLLTLAQAYVFFEKLILKLLIYKPNRKFCAAACVLLSAKLNDIKGQDLKALIEKLECGFRLNHKDLIITEFRVLIALEFSLHLPTWEVFPHYQRLLYES